ncbi:MAG: hypothetical protein R3272_11095 [Candidatus Promineifilaceae bacterium]|nr:hypothetical protein [Candidatus Promineifilaceae bacterium]
MTQYDILLFWLPLFASWLLMTAEGPTVTAAINRLPQETIMLAAQGIVVSLEVTIESPIINMLATATALVKDRQSYEQVRRFAIHWAIVLTIVAAALAFTPLFDLVVVDLLGTPLEVARWVRPGLQIMTLWSAAISWRRFLQGVLIHFGYTRVVAWGTAVRLAASGGTAIGLALYGAVPGVVLGALALMAGVVAEAIYATLAVRPLLQNELAPEAQHEGDEEPLSYGELFWFHLPLASTAVLTLLAQPLVAFALARLDNPTLSLAAWPLIFQLILMARAAAMALPEAVIALTKGPESYEPIRRFAFSLSGLSILGMVLLVVTPALPFYLRGVQDAEATVAALAQSGTVLFVLFPALFVLVSWLRGLLIKQRATAAVNYGMALNLAVTTVLLIAGIQLQWRGILTAALALNVAIVAELLFLAYRTRKQLEVGFAFFLPRKLPLTASAEGGP